MILCVLGHPYRLLIACLMCSCLEHMCSLPHMVSSFPVDVIVVVVVVCVCVCVVCVCVCVCVSEHLCMCKDMYVIYAAKCGYCSNGVFFLCPYNFKKKRLK